MVRYLTENDVQQLLNMPLAVSLVEESLKARALGRAIDVPRVRTHTPQGTLHVLEAASQDLNRIGFKAYYSSSSGTRFHVMLYDLTKGPLLAMVEANLLGIIRTGAASGVATKYLAREDASIVAMIGAGRQAVGQLEAETLAVEAHRTDEVGHADAHVGSGVGDVVGHDGGGYASIC